jgi:hypothetical protein
VYACGRLRLGSRCGRSREAELVMIDASCFSAIGEDRWGRR